ncbi:E3 SUMO-protein ligase NSE2 [Rhinophrynus dorsalis]
MRAAENLSRMSGRAAPGISFSSVDNSLSSLKNCQAYINTGMEIATGVALDLLETGCDTTNISEMESVMMEYASLDRDLNQYVNAAEEIMSKFQQEEVDQVPDLRALVKERYLSLQSKNTDDDLKKCDRVVQFKDQLREMRKQMGLPQDEEREEAFEDVDEDIAVTQSQLNFTCPITQLEMTNPVKNKVCGHTYEREAIERMIQNRHRKKKAARCPKIGCDHSDVQISDLVPDTSLKRAIESHNKQKGRH